MKVCFLYPGSHCFDSVDHWVRALGRFVTEHEVILARSLEDCLAHQPQVAFSITEATCHPGPMIDHERVVLADQDIPCAVLWNNDVNGPTPGEHPSFVWTQRSQKNLAAYRPTLCRMPVFPPTVYSTGNWPLRVGTFGAIEPKKQIGRMWEWARKNNVPFSAFGPSCLVRDNGWYVDDLRLRGCPVTIHTWLPKIEDLYLQLREVTHFLFVLPEAKGGTGGSPTSPRYAGLFGRPVLVVDDEDTYAQDGYHVFASLEEIDPSLLPGMRPPTCHWSPARYLDALVRETLDWWDTHRGERWFE